jgi:hypothetical protein
VTFAACNAAIRVGGIEFSIAFELEPESHIYICVTPMLSDRVMGSTLPKVDLRQRIACPIKRTSEDNRRNLTAAGNFIAHLSRLTPRSYIDRERRTAL